ncbi:MAG: mannose-1-phosphate guanylyltransferase/mannose-6-phosphate isomerase [Glaciimonas sp.]|nr:mannose-1-phosphate guanylyltransferase/mannose-6-phosphate isomerase [Glaciimonas sp.]
MTTSPLIPVILCGGSGTRLWPLSRETYPKQFLRLLGQDTLLQQTMQRLAGIEDVDPAILICNETSRFVVAEQLREIGIENAQILLEPTRRNTAPAIAAAALQALSRGNDPLLLVLPSDHVINNHAAFYSAVHKAKIVAEKGKLVTFGITPLGPETGYGYIRAGAAEPGPAQAQPVIEYVEKPDRATAERYLASGHYFWNSGMFIFRASCYLEELTQFEPDIVAACSQAMTLSKQDFSFIRLDSQSYSRSPDKAVDYAVMERTTNATMVAMDADWNDIGSWASVWKASEKDQDNNAKHGDVMLQDCQGCLVHGSSRLITAVGMRNTIIVETADALLIMDADSAQETKKLVEHLIETKRTEATQHREIFRPWGSYDSIEVGTRFHVKRITVKQGAKLSLQMHHHRAEHWVVVSGTAKITNGDQEYLLTENQSTYIPLGVVHSLENPGKIPLELIEIQSGTYLGEDDIVRLQDNYGRVGTQS